MKIISCEYCGVLLDINRFPPPFEQEYRSGEFEKQDCITCPVCCSLIFCADGETYS